MTGKWDAAWAGEAAGADGKGKLLNIWYFEPVHTLICTVESPERPVQAGQGALLLEGAGQTLAVGSLWPDSRYPELGKLVFSGMKAQPSGAAELVLLDGSEAPLRRFVFPELAGPEP